VPPHGRGTNERLNRMSEVGLAGPAHMVMDPTGAQVKLPGLHTTEPTFGLPAT